VPVSSVSLAPYRRALASRSLRHALILGLIVRTPLFASSVLLTLHVVTTLNRSYGWAGLAAAVVTTTIAIGGPWRGRLLDRHGLRKVVVPSIVISGGCWAVAPWVDYWSLIGFIIVAGLFAVPALSVTRQAVIASVEEPDRRTAIALDAVMLEVSFMIAPALAVWAVTQWSTSVVLFVGQMLGVVGGVLLCIADPPLREADLPQASSPAAVPFRSWFGRGFIAVCAATAATAVVLSGTDLTIVAALREIGAVAHAGIVLALWGLGSLVGGLLYGALSRPISAFWLLLALAAVTFPMAVAESAVALGVTSFLAGLLCAPTITATVDQVTRLVPAEVRGEAIGWHGSVLTAGGAIGAPLAGVVIDRWGAGSGFAAVALVGLLVAVLGVTATRVTRTRQSGGAHPVVHSAPR
jgi:predicted MFS family arabinose efflux permease